HDNNPRACGSDVDCAADSAACRNADLPEAPLKMLKLWSMNLVETMSFDQLDGPLQARPLSAGRAFASRTTTSFKYSTIHVMISIPKLIFIRPAGPLQEVSCGSLGCTSGLRIVRLP